MLDALFTQENRTTGALLKALTIFLYQRQGDRFSLLEGERAKLAEMEVKQDKVSVFLALRAPLTFYEHVE